MASGATGAATAGPSYRPPSQVQGPVCRASCECLPRTGGMSGAYDLFRCPQVELQPVIPLTLSFFLRISPSENGSGALSVW